MNEKVLAILEPEAKAAGLSVTILWAFVRPLIVATVAKWATPENIALAVNKLLTVIDGWVEPGPVPVPPTPPVVGSVLDMECEPGGKVYQMVADANPEPCGAVTDEVQAINWSNLIAIAAKILSILLPLILTPAPAE